MPIKNFMDGEVQYLIQYEPFGLPNTQVEPTSIDQMISIDTRPLETSTVINYSIGAKNTYTFVIKMKNITNNAILDVIVTLPPQIFTSSQAVTLAQLPDAPLRRVINITLNPQQQQEITITLDKNFLNTQVNYSKLETSLPINIRSRANNSVITKNINVTTFQQTVLPTTINVV